MQIINRMKGIPTPCIKYYATQNSISVLDVYKQLYNNKSIKFDLMMVINLYVEILRTIQFQMCQISPENVNTVGFRNFIADFWDESLA